MENGKLIIESTVRLGNAVAETLNVCPVCGCDDVDKIHHAASFALPECWTKRCNGCDWESGAE